VTADVEGLKRSRLLLAVSALLGAITEVLYGVLVRGQDAGPVNPQPLRAPFIVAFVALIAGASLLVAIRPLQPARAPLLGFSAIGFIGAGFMGIFSIGLPLIVAGALVVTAAVQSSKPARRLVSWVPALTGGALAAVLLVVGLQLTEFPTACPATGYEGGSGSALITGAYHWHCANGQLTVAAGECHTGGARIAPDGHVVEVTGCQ
jgi:hypothetical protein